MEIKKYDNFWVEVKSEYQFDIVVNFMMQMYSPEWKPSTAVWNYSKLSVTFENLVGFQDTPTYDLKLSHKDKKIMTFREFLDSNIINK